MDLKNYLSKYGWIYKIALLSVTLLSARSYAEPASDLEMVMSAINSEARTSDQNRVDEIVRESRRLIDEIASEPQQLNERVGAAVIFSSGRSPEEVQSIFEVHPAEISRIESKIPVGDEGKVFTMSVGASDLLRMEGSVNEKIRMGVGSQRINLLMMGQKAKDEQMTSAALNPIIKIYKVDVIGELSNIQNLFESSDIAAVFLDTKNVMVANFDNLKAQAVEMRANMPAPVIRRLEEGPPPGVQPEQIFKSRNFPTTINLPNSIRVDEE